jgi:integrase
MTIDIAALHPILQGIRSKAVLNLLADQPAPFKKGDLARIESQILTHAPEGVSFVDLFDLVRKIAVDAKTPESLLVQGRVAVEYPLPKNPFSEGIKKAEGICTAASSWLGTVHTAGLSGLQQSATQPGPALSFILFLVSTILEFRLLHADYIPAILRSVREKRYFRMHNKISAIPLALNYGKQENAERRLLILRQRSAKLFHEFLIVEGARLFLESFSREGGRASSRTEGVLQALQRDARNDPAVAGRAGGPEFPRILELIEAARTMAVLELPPVVVAHRSRKIVSHSLPPEALRRIAGYPLDPFPLPQRVGNQAGSVSDDPDVKDPEDLGEEPPWMGILRNALDLNGLNQKLLDQLLAGTEITAKLLAEFALYLANPKSGQGGRRGSVKCKPPTVRRYCLLIATKVIPRLGDCPATKVSDDFWEDAIEQILDEDEFYHLKRYAAKPSSNAQTHSRPLVKALRHWLGFLHKYNKNSTTLEKRLPPLGLVKVDASMITADEYFAALGRLVSGKGKAEMEEREAARMALTLGYRCGLRRSEAAYLRICDFDGIGYLHLRPTTMRLLKTSNARRDLPLKFLIPPVELRRLQKRIEAVSRLASKMGISSDQAFLFSISDNPGKLMDFKSVVTKINLAFRGDKSWGWGVIDSDFHFHRLRHSLCNMLLLKLWPELHQIADFIFKEGKNRATRVEIKDCEQTRQDLFGTTAIRAHDLQAIALLMGHGSAATSLEHYLHVLDWYESGESQKGSIYSDSLRR